MKLIHTAVTTQILIPSTPVTGDCEHCGQARNFRLLLNQRHRHLGFFIQWDHEEDVLRVCTECHRAHPMRVKEIRHFIPTYKPLPPRGRRRLVQLVFGIPVLVVAVVWNIAQFMKA